MDSISERIKPMMSEDWFKQLEDHLNSQYVSNLFKYLRTRRENKISIYPKQENIFRVFREPFNNIKVVILGQDPYYTLDVADGLAFSSKIANYVPPSLENIYKEIESDIYGTQEKVFQDPNLDYLAAQGVFLYNTALTVECGKPESHLKVWEKFTEEVLNKLNESDPKVFMLWGNYAKKYKKYITNYKHLILESGHPSPLSANRGYWFGNKHFSKANEFLNQIYGKESEIKWDSPPF